MSAEAAAPGAEIAARLRNIEIRDVERLRFRRHVDDPHSLARFTTLVHDLLVDDHHEIAQGALRVFCELGQGHAQERQRGVRAVGGLQIEPAHLRIEQVLVGRLLGAVQELLAVDDLQHPVLVRAVAEIDAVALGAGGDGAVQIGRRLPGRSRLLPGQPEIADEHRLRGVGEVVHLGHAPHAPAFDPGDQVGDA